MTVGERIKKVRNKLGMSQVDFADKINVSKQTLYKYENNIITNIPSDKIEAAARLGNVSPAYLMGWTISDEDIANVFVLHDLEDIIDNIRDFSPPTKAHFKNYLRLHEIARRDVDKYTNQLLSLQEMKTGVLLNAAHPRTDIDVPEGTNTSDDDIMNDTNF